MMTRRGAILVLVLTDFFMVIFLAAHYVQGYVREAANGGLVTLAVNIAALLVFSCMPFWDD